MADILIDVFDPDIADFIGIRIDTSFFFLFSSEIGNEKKADGKKYAIS